MPTAADTRLLDRETRSQWLRLRTLILLRWLAIVGQASAVAVADRVYGLHLPLGPVYLVIGLAVIANLVATLATRGNKRLSEPEAMLTLLFDITQLAALLYLTGGTTNPFSLLILAPVSISATALRLRTTLFLGAAALGLVSLLAVVHQPLILADGSVMTLPPLFGFGFWLALVIGIVFLGLYSHRVASEIQAMSEAVLAMQMALAREQKLSDLSGVVAATAHELGTPLATIKLVSSELADELAESLPDRPDLREDIALLQSQTDRCRDILRSMGRAGKEDRMLRQAPVSAVLREAAEPHMERGKTVHLSCAPGPGGDARQPSVLRMPELVHGLRNLIQNAVDFAATTVWIEARWTEDRLTVQVIDDGPGFPPQVLGRIGDPFVRQRRMPPSARPPQDAARPGYEGMGLGLFIAKTLLERCGAEISFANAADTDGAAAPGARRGAIVEVVLPRDRIGGDPDAALGENRLLVD